MRGGNRVWAREIAKKEAYATSRRQQEQRGRYAGGDPHERRRGGLREKERDEFHLAATEKNPQRGPS